MGSTEAECCIALRYARTHRGHVSSRGRGHPLAHSPIPISWAPTASVRAGLELHTTMVLQADPARLLGLLEYVRYAPSVEVQEQAIQVALLLAARLPGLPDLLLQAGPQGGPPQRSVSGHCLSWWLLRSSACRQVLTQPKRDEGGAERQLRAHTPVACLSTWCRSLWLCASTTCLSQVDVPMQHAVKPGGGAAPPPACSSCKLCSRVTATAVGGLEGGAMWCSHLCTTPVAGPRPGRTATAPWPAAAAAAAAQHVLLLRRLRGGAAHRSGLRAVPGRRPGQQRSH